MGVNANVNVVENFVGDGVRAEFIPTFPFLDNLEVTVDGVVVPFVANISGTGAVISPAPASGASVSLRRVTDLRQSSAFVDLTKFPGQAVEDGLDRLTQIAQEQNLRISENREGVSILDGINAVTLASRPNTVFSINGAGETVLSPVSELPAELLVGNAVVRYDQVQSPSEDEKAVARKNIGLDNSPYGNPDVVAAQVWNPTLDNRHTLFEGKTTGFYHHVSRMCIFEDRIIIAAQRNEDNDYESANGQKISLRISDDLSPTSDADWSAPKDWFEDATEVTNPVARDATDLGTHPLVLATADRLLTFGSYRVNGPNRGDYLILRDSLSELGTVYRFEGSSGGDIRFNSDFTNQVFDTDWDYRVTLDGVAVRPVFMDGFVEEDGRIVIAVSWRSSGIDSEGFEGTIISEDNGVSWRVGSLINNAVYFDDPDAPVWTAGPAWEISIAPIKNGYQMIGRNRETVVDERSYMGAFTRDLDLPWTNPVPYDFGDTNTNRATLRYVNDDFQLLISQNSPISSIMSLYFGRGIGFDLTPGPRVDDANTDGTTYVRYGDILIDGDVAHVTYTQYDDVLASDGKVQPQDIRYVRVTLPEDNRLIVSPNERAVGLHGAGHDVEYFGDPIRGIKLNGNGQAGMSRLPGKSLVALRLKLGAAPTGSEEYTIASFGPGTSLVRLTAEETAAGQTGLFLAGQLAYEVNNPTKFFDIGLTINDEKNTVRLGDIEITMGRDAVRMVLGNGDDSIVHPTSQEIWFDVKSMGAQTLLPGLFSADDLFDVVADLAGQIYRIHSLHDQNVTLAFAEQTRDTGAYTTRFKFTSFDNQDFCGEVVSGRNLICYNHASLEFRTEYHLRVDMRGLAEDALLFLNADSGEEAGVVFVKDAAAEADIRVAANNDIIVRAKQSGTLEERLKFVSFDDCWEVGAPMKHGGALSHSHSDMAVAAGAIGKPTTAVVRIDTELSAATDDLTDIGAGDDWQRLILVGRSSSRDVTVKTTGNIRLANGNDVALTTNGRLLELIYSPDRSQWLQISPDTIV